MYLFHSGTPDVRKAIMINDILPVYGEGHAGMMKAVGKIKVLSFEGETYFKAKVVEGEIRHDDIARKGAAACLVILEGEMFKQLHTVKANDAERLLL